jgi:hypothetical protein
MRKLLFVLSAVLMIAFLDAFTDKQKEVNAAYIPASVQRGGDATKGYEYLVTGDFLKSGFPYDFFLFAYGNSSNNYLNRTGKAANVDYKYNVVKNADSMDIVIPTCLQCHAQVFDGKLYIGLGNSAVDFTDFSQKTRKLSFLKIWKSTSPQKYNAVRSLLTALITVDPQMETEVRGVNSADRLAALLVAHRNPQTLIWSDSALLDIPGNAIPTDVPAWWLLKKKNAMFYSGFGRGDFGKFLMLSNILTVSDSSEASEVDSHFGDVLAYILSIEPPKYPFLFLQTIVSLVMVRMETTAASLTCLFPAILLKPIPCSSGLINRIGSLWNGLTKAGLRRGHILQSWYLVKAMWRHRWMEYG